jgi:hypothetical protein
MQADEAYWFFYTQAFGAHAVILIGKRRDEITVERRYHAGMFNEAERLEALLSDADWRRLQDALAAVDFWSLPREVRPQGSCLDHARQLTGYSPYPYAEGGPDLRPGPQGWADGKSTAGRCEPGRSHARAQRSGDH